jgi:hypothetical protein
MQAKRIEINYIAKKNSIVAENCTVYTSEENQMCVGNNQFTVVTNDGIFTFRDFRLESIKGDTINFIAYSENNKKVNIYVWF